MNDQGLQQNHHEFYKVNMSMSAILDFQNVTYIVD